MKYHVLTPHETSGVLKRAMILAAITFILTAVVTGYLATLPLTVTVDGETVRIPAGTTVGMLEEGGFFEAGDGDLIAIDGNVATPGAGGSVRIFRNGSLVGPNQRVYRDDDLVSQVGLSRHEATETVTLAVDYDSEVKGIGPIVEVSRSGKPGARRVVRGVASHIEITSTVLALPVTEVLVRRGAHPGSKLVALTFDDGPWPKQTDRILKILAEEEVRATFFLLGLQVKRQPAIARRVVAGEHQVASHSMRHRRFSALKPGEIAEEVKSTRKAIKRATGVSTSWIRPPYGAMDAEAWRTLRKMGVHTVMWDVDSNDWRRPGAKQIARGVVSHVKPGSIVLFHDGGGDRGQTAAALRSVIRQLKRKGYIFVTVEELVAADGVAKRPAAKKASVSKQ